MMHTTLCKLNLTFWYGTLIDERAFAAATFVIGGAAEVSGGRFFSPGEVVIVADDDTADVATAVVSIGGGCFMACATAVLTTDAMIILSALPF